MQADAQRALEAGLARVDRRVSASNAGREAQGALIAMQPQTGFIRTLVGGRNYMASQFNRVTQARRQVGSVFKPIVYAAVLESVFTQTRVTELFIEGTEPRGLCPLHGMGK